MPKTNQSSIALSFLCFVFFCGCGGATQGIQPSSPFTEKHAKYFEDGIDFIREPGILEGQWFKDWEADLKKRIAYSDYIAVVTVKILRTDLDLDRKSSFRLITEVDRRLQGVSVGKELTLIVHESQDGYASVEDKASNILNLKFVAYVKWYENDKGEVAAHWHLSPASDAVVLRTEEIIQERLDAKRLQRRVVIHRDEY
jgi:hypothetical protein